jgi:hypothetical protein
MSTAILSALRLQTQLHGNTFLIATELAHRLNSSGFGRVAYRFLAWKAHCSPRTAMRQVARLLDMGLIKKVVMRTREGYAWNLYQYIGARPHTASPPITTHSDSLSGTLPPPEREKERSLREDLERQKKGLRFWTPGSDQWTKSYEEIARLEGLLRC